MKRAVSAVGWIMAGAVLAAITAVIAGLIEPNMPHAELGRWVRETGFPPLERLVKVFVANPLAPLSSPWAPWAVGLIAALVATPLLRHFLGRPRWPSEYKADLRLANEFEACADKREKAVAKYRVFVVEQDLSYSKLVAVTDKLLSLPGADKEYEKSRRKLDEALHNSAIAQHGQVTWFSTGLPVTCWEEFRRRKIKIAFGKVSLTPEWLEMEARCWRKIASALRNGTYKHKTFHVHG
jgi:hypothetical protein